MSEPADRPLTEAQEGLWYAHRLDPANPLFNTGQYLDLRGELDVAALTAAVDGASAEAQALSLVIRPGADGPVQRVDPSRAPRLVTVDLSDAPDPEAAALAAIGRDMATVVDPARDPLAAQTLYRLGPDRHWWAQRVHHLAIDGYATVLLTARVAELYNRAVTARGLDRPLPALDGVWAEDGAYRRDDARVGDAAWWRDAMAGVEEVGGPAAGPARSADRVLRDARSLPAGLRDALLARAKAIGVSWPDLLVALVAGYLHRFSTTPETVIGLPHMGRMGSAAARVPAMVMNVLPLRVAPDEHAPLDEAVRALAARMAEARAHGRYRSEQLRRDLGLIGAGRRLYGPLVNVQPYDRPPRLHGLAVALHVTGTGPVDDLNVTFRGDGTTGLTLEIDANPALYTADAVAAHAARLEQFLATAAGAPRLADVPTATPAEAAAELAAHAAAHPLGEDADATLADLLDRAFRATPDATALRFDGETLTYAELDRRSAALAAALVARGARAEAIVAVALPRSTELVVALVAAVRAGAAYLPVDPDQPAARRAALIADARPVAVLAQDDPDGVYGDRLFAPAAWPGEATATLPAPRPDDAAYVIYTSGSTGAPKGVVVPHRAIVNRLLWMRAHYAVGAADRILQKTPATFDVSVWEFFLPLIAGGTLVVAPPGAHRDPRALARLIRDERITVLHFVPSMLAAFLDAPDSAGLVVRLAFCSGEALPAALRDRFHARVRGALHNLYGPTEAAVDVSFWAADADDRSDPVPIGYPVWNTRLVILDAFDRPVPPGAVGQLHLGGVQLARGYLGQPALTAERFIPDPFRPGERLYRTGDLARRRADGAVVFLGRADDQVKVRGMRVEPGEIEAAIAATGLTRAATVILRDGRLVGYLVPGTGYDADRLHAALSATLPEHMVPAALVPLAALPVTANGKLDRGALPAPVLAGRGDAPATYAEERLAAIFGEVLGVAAVTRDDDFFALGGDSLSAVRLALRIEQEWGRDPGLGAVFEHPRLAALAARLDDGAGESVGLGPLLRLASGSDAEPPLFVVHPAGGLAWGYRTLAHALSPPRAVWGLQSPALDPDAPAPASIDALADDYARRIAERQPDGPVHLAGWSVGGIIAQAAAVALRAMGREVGLVGLLDSYPAECWRAEPEPTEAQALGALLAIAGHDPDAHPDLTSRDAVLDFLRRGGSALGSLPPRALAGVVRTVLDTNRLVRAHDGRRYDGVLTHIRAGLDHRDRPGLVGALWRPYAAAVECLSVPFLHPQLTGAAAVAAIAPALAERMAATRRIAA